MIVRFYTDKIWLTLNYSCHCFRKLTSVEREREFVGAGELLELRLHAASLPCPFSVNITEQKSMLGRLFSRPGEYLLLTVNKPSGVCELSWTVLD